MQRLQFRGESGAIAGRLSWVEGIVRLARSRGGRAATVGAMALLFGRRPRQILRTAWRLRGLWSIASPFIPMIGRLLRRR